MYGSRVTARPQPGSALSHYTLQEASLANVSLKHLRFCISVDVNQRWNTKIELITSTHGVYSTTIRDYDSLPTRAAFVCPHNTQPGL